MSENRKPSKLLRIVAIVLMSLTVFVTILGGAGTTCVALGAEKFGSMAVLAPFKPLYLAFVVVSLGIGIWGIPVTLTLIRGGDAAYRNALTVLIAGAVVSGTHTAVSQALRGASAPASWRFYINLVTLVVFLLFRLPSVRDRVDFTQSMRGSGKRTSGGTALIVCGLVALTTYLWAGSTHLSSWIDVLRVPLLSGGWGMLLAGFVLAFIPDRPVSQIRVSESLFHPRRA